MNLKNILQEMAKELLPNVSSEDDLKIIRELKKLYKKNRQEFHSRLKRINLIRRSEKLSELTPTEIVKGYTKKTIEVSQEENREKEEKKKKAIYSDLSFRKDELVISIGVFQYLNDLDSFPILYFEGKVVGYFVIRRKNNQEYITFHTKNPSSKVNLPKVTYPIEHKEGKKMIFFPKVNQKVILTSGYTSARLKIKDM